MDDDPQATADYRPLRFSLGAVFFTILIAAAICSIAYYAVQARKAARRMSESTNLKNIVLALHNYHDYYKVFPVACVNDVSGRGYLSWRVAITPFIESKNPLGAYRRNEAWDSLFNDALCRSNHAPIFFAPDQPSRTGHTNIVMVVGKGTLGEKPVTMAEVTDGASTTIAVFALKPSDIAWHEPRDLQLSEITRASGNKQRILIRGKLFQGGLCGFVDGSVHWLPADLDYDTFIAMLTIAGGEQVDMSWDQGV